MAIEYSRDFVSVSGSSSRGSISGSSSRISPVTSPSGRPDGDDDSVSFNPGVPGDNVVSNLILSSSLYKEAKQILSADREYGSSYLSLLNMIPYSHQVRDDNFWDNFVEAFGGTSGYEKAVKDAFNTAMDEIRSLMQDYYSFLSKLPAEQVEQLRDAGINSAITGEGVSTSGMSSPDPSSLISPNPSQGVSEYTNTALSNGVTSFVEFIGSMANLGKLGLDSKNLLGLLDIAERESYNKQQTHDLLLAGLGVTTDSPYRVLSGDNTPIVNTLASTARDDQRVKSAEAAASAKALDSSIPVNIGNNPDDVDIFEIKSGEDWLTEISRFKIATRFADTMTQNIVSMRQQLYSDILSSLEGEYNVANFAAQAAESNFNFDYYNSRKGSIEGQNQTNLSTYLANLREHDAYIRSIEAWKEDYRAGIIEHWGTQLELRPNLAPYFYKAMFDFNMEDTFYHQNGAAQALKYGLKSLDSIGSFIGHLTGLKRPVLPPRKTGQTTTTTGPKGQTTTHTTYQFE